MASNAILGRRRRNAGAALVFFTLFAVGTTDIPLQAQETETPSVAEAALTQMQQGDCRGAAKQVRQALQTRPDEPALNALAGTLLLNSGDSRGALALFQSAAYRNPEDSLTLYGLGLAQLARGERAEALSSFENAERHGGDRACLSIARRYVQWLEGVGRDAAPPTDLPEAASAAWRALDGMTAARKGDRPHAVKNLEAAQAALPGDAIVEPLGPLMSFEAARPVFPGEQALPVEDDLNPAHGVVKDKTVGGDVALAPDDLTAGVGYVAYELDGEALGLVGSRPFQYEWDTQRAKNGWHAVTVILYDRQVQEISRTTRRYHVFNRSAAVAAPNTERRTRLQAALWQAMALKPDRCVCAYTLGASYLALGDRKAARLWFARTVAIQPDYRDARHQLAACGGLSEGGPAVYSGLPTEKVVALTFDDGPKPGVTEPLLDMLIAGHVPSTFFVIGKHVMEYPELTRKISAAGMEIANHSYTHRSLISLSEAEATREMLETQAAVMTVTGQTPRFVRPPGGNWNGRVGQIAKQWGLTPCMWTVDVFNAEIIGAQRVAEAVLEQVKPGSIILMHNGKVSTLQALPTILRVLKARGYAFVTVDTLMRRRSAAKSVPTPRIETPRHHAE